MNAVDSNLSATAGDHYRTLRTALWAAIDDEISLSECDIYSYNPDFAFGIRLEKMDVCGH